jgi:hypothetical protein
MEKVQRYEREPRKPIAPVKVWSEEDIAKAQAAFENELPGILSVDRARSVWEQYKDVLDAPTPQGTLKDELNRVVSDLQK